VWSDYGRRVQPISPPPGPGVILRPLRVGEIIDASFKIAVRNVRQLFPFIAPLFLPFLLISSLALQQFSDEVSKAGLKAGQTPEETQAAFDRLGDIIRDRAAFFVGLLVAIVLIQIVLQTISSAALTVYIGESLMGRVPDRKSSLKLAFRRAPALLAASLLAGLSSLLAGALFLVVGFLSGSGWIIFLGAVGAVVVSAFLFIRFYVAAPAVVLERIGPIRGLRRSFRLVRGRWWAMLGLALLSGILSGIIASIISSIITSLLNAIGGNNSDFRFVWQAVGGTISQGLVAPFTAAVLVLAYIDLRVRNEAFDLELLGQSIESRPQTPSPYG
jgi:hypothetical protein